jgi:UDP-N-acetylglucosamine enolpyruvyl transferase
MMREVRGVNDTLAAELGDGDDDRVRRANLEALDIFVSKIIAKMARGEVPDVKDIKSLSEIQKNIGIAARTSLDVEIRKKREWEAEQKRKLEEMAAAERADGNVLAAEFAERALRHLGL